MAKKVNSNFVVLLTLQKSKETNKVYSAVTVLHSTLWTTVKYTEAKSNWFFNCNNHVQRFLPKPRLGSQWNSFFVSLIEEPHFHKNGAGGRFSHLRVGKIFYIYLCNMKNSTVKAINRSNTNCPYFVAGFQTQIYSDTTVFGGGRVGGAMCWTYQDNNRKVHILVRNSIKWNFCPQH